MDNQKKAILSQIDDLIDKAEDGEITLSDEALNLLNEIVDYINIKKAKDKTKPIEDLIIKIDELLKVVSDNSGISKETAEAVVSAIKELKIDVAAPDVTVEPPKVEVKVPPISIPRSVIEFPDEMNIKKPSWISGIVNLSSIITLLKEIKSAISTKPTISWPKSAKEAIAVRLSDGEKFYRAIGGLSSAIGSSFPFKTKENEQTAALVNNAGNIQTDIVPYAMKTEVDGSITYVALAIPGTALTEPKWQVRKIDETTGTIITWADGDAEFDNIASDLTTLSYI